MTSNAECLSTTWPQTAPSAPACGLNEDALLVRRAQASDPMAFREIVDRHQAMVFALIGRVLRTRAEAEDIAQEVFLRVFFSIGRYRYEGALATWIYKIALNECYSYLRRKKARPLLYESDIRDEDKPAFEVRSHARPADRTVADRDLAVKLLARVSERERFLLVMREVEGYSIEELSKLTGINPSSVKVKLLRARRKLLKAAKSRGWSA